MVRLTALLAAAALVAGAVAPAVLSEPAVAQQAAKKKGLKGSIGYRRAYSYSKQDVVGSEIRRRSYDPRITEQSPGGPFDSGFFFDSAIRNNGGDAPYMQ
jgi:hypothetical protein